MVRVIAVAFAPAPGLGFSSGQQALEILARDGWAPENAQITLVLAPCRWWGALEAILAAAGAQDAIVLLGEQQGARLANVAGFAHNAARPIVDTSGLTWPGASLAPRAPGLLRSTLPAEELARAIEASGLPAGYSDKGDGYVYNRCLYGLLARRRLAGLVRLPASIESARREGRLGQVNRLQILEGVKAALRFAAARAELALAA